MAKKQKNESAELDLEKSVMLAKTLLKHFDGVSYSELKSVLNGLTITIAELMRITYQDCEVSEEDGLEKLVLSWFSATDSISGLNFRKYITGIETKQENDKKP